jgi:DNA-binding SARP family transcriptional activator
MDPGISVTVLGSWLVRDGTAAVTIPFGQLRVLLSSLLLADGAPVRVGTLATQLWTGDPPARVRGTVHTYVTRLRRLLGDDAILTCPADGYRLRVDRDRVDLYRFRDLLRRAGAAHDPGDELALLHLALRTWQGRPFAGVESPWLERDVVPLLTEEWLAATERRIDLEVAQGGAGAPIAELRELTAAYPLREALWSRLISALYRSGRRADALAAYQQIRILFQDELGLDLGDDLQRLHEAVLRDDPAAGRPWPQPNSTAEPSVRGPYQLPHDSARFVGRAGALAELDAAAPAGATGTTVVVIDGAAGTGKTELAVHWAHRVAERYPDVQMYLDLHGFSGTDPVCPAVAARTLLGGLGVAPANIPAGIEERTALLRSRLAGRRGLILLDNARDAAQVRPLLPGTDCLVIVTSRNQLRSLSIRDGAHRVTVGRLSPAEAIALLSGAAGHHRVTAEPRAAARLAWLCDRLPLALAIAAERVRRAGSLHEVAVALADERSRLDAFGDDDGDPGTDLRTTLTWSYRTLAPSAARMFRRLGCHPVPGIGLAAASALTELPEARARQALDQLVATHLVEQGPGDRYEMHDLLRLYAREEGCR